MTERGTGDETSGPVPDRAHAATDHTRVRELIGREPAGRFDVVVRDAVGDPVVIRNAPLLDDGTPMPTRYWLVGRDAVVAVSRLESAGGVRAAERAVDATELAAAHDRYAAERDAELPADAPIRPAGGVAGTRVGVKCLHAHYAWHLAGGDDPVGRWVAEQLIARLDVEISVGHIVLRHAEWTTRLPIDPRSLANELAASDPPSPVDLTNALGAVSDHVDDAMRIRPAIIDATVLSLSGDEAWHLAIVERGLSELRDPVTVTRDDLEDLFRTLATETRADREHNPALHADRVDLIVATLCAVLATMRKLQFTAGTFLPSTIAALEPTWRAT